MKATTSTRVRLSRLGLPGKTPAAFPLHGGLIRAARPVTQGRRGPSAAALLSARGIRTGALRPCGLRSLTIRLTNPKQEGAYPVRMRECGKDGRPPTLHWHTVNIGKA